MKVRNIMYKENEPVPFKVRFVGKEIEGTISAYVAVRQMKKENLAVYINPVGYKEHIEINTKHVDVLKIDRKNYRIVIIPERSDLTFMIDDNGSNIVMALGHLMSPYVNRVENINQDFFLKEMINKEDRLSKLLNEFKEFQYTPTF